MGAFVGCTDGAFVVVVGLEDRTVGVVDVAVGDTVLVVGDPVGPLVG